MQNTAHSCTIWTKFSQAKPRSLQAVKLDRFNIPVHRDVYFIGIHQLFADLLSKDAHTGKDELTVA